MPTVGELTAPAGNYPLNPRPGPGVCRVCFNLTDGFARCYACGSVESWLAAVAPISYSFSGGQLHHALAGHKRTTGPAARRMSVELAAIMWRFLAEHEPCVARAAGADRFKVVATVPSGERPRDEQHPLRRIVGELCGPTRERHERLLLRSKSAVAGHAFEAGKYEPVRGLNGESVILIDDTWTTGANAQSAAAALREAGAARVAAVVVGRYLNREWHQNERRLRASPPTVRLEQLRFGRQRLNAGKRGSPGMIVGEDTRTLVRVKG
jgi:predicted amidophosphoribosyltransferase